MCIGGGDFSGGCEVDHGGGGDEDQPPWGDPAVERVTGGEEPEVLGRPGPRGAAIGRPVEREVSCQDAQEEPQVGEALENHEWTVSFWFSPRAAAGGRHRAAVVRFEAGPVTRICGQMGPGRLG